MLSSTFSRGGRAVQKRTRSSAFFHEAGKKEGLGCKIGKPASTQPFQAHTLKFHMESNDVENHTRRPLPAIDFLQRSTTQQSVVVDVPTKLLFSLI